MNEEAREFLLAFGWALLMVLFFVFVLLIFTMLFGFWDVDEDSAYFVCEEECFGAMNVTSYCASERSESYRLCDLGENASQHACSEIATRSEQSCRRLFAQNCADLCLEIAS